MRTLTSLVLLVLFACHAGSAAEPPAVSLEARDMPLADAIGQLSKQAGLPIVLDSKASGTVTVNLSQAKLSQALDVISKLNKLTWKKISFARPEGETVKLEQIRSGLVALASMPMVGLMVDDPSTTKSAVYARDLPVSPNPEEMKLPEGYAWTTVYVMLAEEPSAATATATSTEDKVYEVSLAENRRLQELATMVPEERQRVFADEWVAQLSLTPEARQAMLRDRFRALFSLDPQVRDQIRQDMRSVFQGIGRGGDQRRGDRDGRRDR